MTTRSLPLYGAVAVIGLIAGGAFALWTASFDADAPSREPVVANSTPVSAQGADRRTRIDYSGKSDLRVDESVGLNDDSAAKNGEADDQPSQALAEEKAQDSALRKFDWAMAEPPMALDLELPDSATAEPDQDTGFAAAEAPVSAESQPVATFDLYPQPESAPHVESYSLFNPEYGLRGFMAQGWVNQRFGVQGGLGLNDDRVIRTESDFSDDIAVGMGVILAF